MLTFAVLALACLLLFYFLALRPANYAPLEPRSILVVRPSEVNRLYGLDWAACRFASEGERLRVMGDLRGSERMADFAHIRALEERLERERFAHRREQLSRVGVRGVVRVVGA